MERPESFGARATLNDEEFAERQATRERQVRADGEIYVPAGPRTGIGGPSHWAAENAAFRSVRPLWSSTRPTGESRR